MATRTKAISITKGSKQREVQSDQNNLTNGQRKAGYNRLKKKSRIGSNYLKEASARAVVDEKEIRDTRKKYELN